MEDNFSSLGHLGQRMQKQWPEVATAQLMATVALQRLGRLFEENARRTLDQFALTTTEFELLSTLRTYPPPHQLMPSELYNALLISSGGLTKVLKALETRALVVRTENKGDRRVHPVQLSATGLKLAEEAMRAVQAADRPIWEAFLESQPNNFVPALERLTALAERQSPRSPSC